MRAKVLLAMGCIAALSACATGPGGPFGVPFDPEHPRVYVLNGKQIVVDQEPIYITRRDAKIVWELPKGFSFPPDGIEIREARGAFECAREAPTRFACTPLNPRRLMPYKYTIKVAPEGKEPLAPLDPSIIADF